MFTGIIEETGTLREIRRGAVSSQLVIGAAVVLEDMKPGDSVSTNGICLTVTTCDKSGFTVDVMPETLRRTSLSQLREGSRLNLERALRLSDRLGGHLVSGHIDGTGTVERRWNEDNAVWFYLRAESSLLKYIVEKGSVALDGISLTVATLDGRGFSVSTIPHTRTITNLLERKPGDLMNIECDVVAKYIERLHGGNQPPSSINLEFLTQNGF